MSDGINRHKSTRWVQTQTASYGDEWDEENDSEAELSQEEEEEEEEEETVEVTHDHDKQKETIPPLPIIPGVNEVSKKLEETSLMDDDITKQELNEQNSPNKRASRFFVTNPDPSDSESEIEPSTQSEGRWEGSPLLQSETETGTIVSKEDSEQGSQEVEAAEKVVDHSEDEETQHSYEDIEPTAPLKVPSRVSSRHPSVNLDENNNDKLSSEKREKLKSRDYSNIDLVMDDYLSKRDSQFYEEDTGSSPERVKEMEKVQEESEGEEDISNDFNEENEEYYRYEENASSKSDDLSETLDHDHTLELSNRSLETSQNGLSVTPNDYSLSKSLSSGSLSTGSWSVRSSAQFMNGPSSARDSFIGKLRNDRRPSIGAVSSIDVPKGVGEEDEENDSSEDKDNDLYMDSSSEEDDDSIKFNPGQSINFGHWRPNTSNFRNAFIKDTNYDGNESVLPSVNEEEREYDDSYSAMTDQSSLRFGGEEGHFFTKPLEPVSSNDDSILDREDYDKMQAASSDTVNTADLSDGVLNDQQRSSLDPLNGGKLKEVGMQDDDDKDSNATETELIDDEDDDEGTDIDESSGVNDTSMSTNEELSSYRPQVKQRYSSLLSGTTNDTRQTSMSSSIDPPSRKVSDSKDIKETRNSSMASGTSSQQTTLYKKIATTKNFAPYDFKQIQKLTNPENRITELRKIRKQETEVDTGLQDWLTTELTKVSSSQEGYDALGPIALNAYKQLTPTTHLHSHSVADMISRKHSINFGGVVGHGRLKLKNKVGDHGGNLAKGIFNRGKKIMRNNSNGHNA